MTRLFEVIFKRLIPNIVDFIAGLLDPSRPGPTLERISVLGNIILGILLVYSVITSNAKQERYALQAGKSDGYVTTIDSLREQIAEYKLQANGYKQQIAEKEFKLEQCLKGDNTGPPHRGIVDEVNDMR